MAKEEKTYKTSSFWVPVAIIAAGALIAGAVIFSGGMSEIDDASVKGSIEDSFDLPTPENPSGPPTPGAEVVEGVSVDDDATIGPKDAKVQIVEFSDYECPFCSRNIPTMEKIVEEYGDKVSITYRDFPLSFHEDATSAAIAAECAGDQGKYWEYHDELFENQEALDEASLKLYAKDLGLKTVDFNKCLDDEKYKDEVEADVADGTKYGVTGTPAVFINGRSIVGAQPYDVFKQVIDEELAK